ncbi:MAG TPA: UDP-N-acetylmuramoyl-tripeptide--D-alanyl-D-alanine ligase [Phycisphaerae bacterium]|nr:UDP-N-acetylmuramoyl-tripeptide--D-alanyl-D-alanine ligase [Phycisphaerae bacterium]
MRPLTLMEMAAAMGGRIVGDVTIPGVTNVCTDSRAVTPGALFFALKGENHDGHAFVNDVLDQGATAAVVTEITSVAAKHHVSGRLVHVPDTSAALGRLAAWYRRQFAAQVIAVVGSNGKTTTKDMISAVLGAKRRGRAAKASFNNSIGVPLTLLTVEPADEFVVVEIGTNHPGEIVALGRIAQPDMVVITSIGEEHLEFFGDVETVASEEFSILTCLRGRAFVVLSKQAAQFAPDEPTLPYTKLTYGLEPDADLRASDITPTGEGQRFKVNGRTEYVMPVLGRHNVINALAAVAIGARFRMAPEDIAAGLRSVRLPPMRMQRVEFGDVSVINDAYNANPSSMAVALEVLDRLDEPRRKVLILGDMRELGERSKGCHQELGRLAGRSTAQLIVAVGAYSRSVADAAVSIASTTKRIYSYPTVEHAAEKIPSLVRPGDIVLLKASRAIRLERLLEPIGQVGAKTPIPV